MKTRRKSKAAAAAAAEAEQPDQTDQDERAGPSKVDLVLNIPDDVDVEYLSSLLPDISLTSPSTDAIIAAYRLIVSQASEVAAAQREADETRADLEKRDIELDQALQDRESAVQEVEGQLEETRAELRKVRLERDELQSSRNDLQHRLSSATTSQSVSSTELDSLKHRVEDTEREKRDLLGVVSRLKEDGAQRDEEVQTLRASLKQARQEYQTLETQLREVRSTESSTKFKLESLTQQLELSQGEAERTSAELTAKSEEFAKYRHSKHAELTRLQSAHDALVQTHASSEGTFRALQSAHTSQGQQLSQALSRVQDLTGRLAEQDATYASEVAGLKRLVEMMEEREAQAKNIVDTIEAEWASVGAKADKREALLRDELEREKRHVEEAENRIEEMERVLEKVNRGEFPVPRDGTVPSTPARGVTPDLMTQGMMGLSPTVAMASRAQKTGKTFTEVYADYVRLQDEYARKAAEYDHMDRTLAQVLAQIEERAPILAQQRAEYERLQSEATQLASQLADALSDRDSSAAAAHDTSRKLSKTVRENELLTKQLNDLGRQVQSLLKELGRRQDPTIPSDEDLEQDPSTQPAENIDEVITNNLVLFRSIGGLQDQNQKLLGIVRELGAKMEAEERDYREALEKEQGEAVREAHDAIQELQAQLESQRKSSEVKIQAYVKERDSLRLLLSRAESAGASRPSEVKGHANGASAASDSELAKELAEIQEQFAAYRTEMGIDSERLREDYVAGQREIAQLNAMLAKANAKIELMTERHKSSQDQYVRQARDIEDLTKRNQQLYDQYTRVDIECNRVTEDLIASNGRLEQLRNECANLRAEKRIWESVQGRLVDENKALSMERSHLSDLMANVQKMHNDLERSGENDRRRLENQIQMLENESQDLKAQVNQERESLRHVTLQREIETKELRGAVDSRANDLGKTRESLVEAETTKKHLEERVAELSRQLQGNEEKLSVYEHRTSTVNGITQHTPADDMTREQQLEVEVADLRSALKVAQVDLANARSNVHQFQEISQANEAALSTLHTTYDEYKASTEAQIAHFQAERDHLQERLQTIEQELANAQEALTESKRSFEGERKEWLSDKKTLEDTIFDLTNSEKTFAEDRTSRESEVQAQEERVKASEDKYSREVLAHAESIKAIDDLKKRLSALQVSSRDSLTAAETAQAKLASSEASWSQQREALDREMADLTARCKALTEQNNVLHQHLESVSSQAARIREAADASASTPGDADSAEDADAKLSELRAVINYLRKEKEIVDMQLELSKQENARLKAQIGHLTHDLEDTRATLSEERERAVSAAATDAQHAELVDKIQQLNLLRESNATLRTDSEMHAKRARELDVQVKSLTKELEPLRERVLTVEADLDAQKGHVVRLEEETRRWQERNSQLLSKYDRIDPAEMQSLKTEIERLTAEKASWETSTTSQDEKVKTLEDEITRVKNALQASKDTYQRAMTGFRARLGEANKEKTSAKEALQGVENQLKMVTAERDSLQAAGSNASKDISDELTKLQAEKGKLEQALQEEKARLTTPSTAMADQEAKIAQLTAERDQLLSEKASWTATAGTSTESEQTKPEWEAEKSELLKREEEAVAAAKAAKEEAEKVQADAQSLRRGYEKLQLRLQDQQKARQRAVEEQEAIVKAAVEKATSELQNTPQFFSAPEDLLKRHTEELHALEERLKAEHESALKAVVEAASNAVPPPAEDRAGAIEHAVAAKEAEMRVQNEEAIAKAIESGRQEIISKMKVKDGQLIRIQGRLKQLEGQVEEWKKAGLIPHPTSPTGEATAAPVASTSAAPSSETATASPTTTRGGAPGGLPRRPTLGNAASAAGPASTVPHTAERGRGRGRGLTRGLSIRGTAAPGHAGRGGGVSIAGAAAKRAREEGETGGEGALAKRLKPAEPSVSAPSGSAGAASAAGGTGSSKPVTLQRNRVGPS